MINDMQADIANVRQKLLIKMMLLSNLDKEDVVCWSGGLQQRPTDEAGNLSEASWYLSNVLRYLEREPGSEGIVVIRVPLSPLEFKRGNHTEGTQGRDHPESQNSTSTLICPGASRIRGLVEVEQSFPVFQISQGSLIFMIAEDGFTTDQTTT
jgi:hypothetical protein